MSFYSNKDSLQEILDKKVLQLPILFQGEDASYLEEEVFCLAKHLLNTKTLSHPDLLSLRPEGKGNTFSFAEVKEALDSLSLPPYQSQNKVLVLLEIEKMLPMHVSLLLKSLEEKPSYVVIFLTTTNISCILPTILSRVAKFSIATKASTIEIKKSLLPIFIAALSKEYKQFYALLEDVLPQIENKLPLEEILECILGFFRDLHLLKSGAKAPLFFEEERLSLQELSSYSIPKYEKILQTLQESEQAFQLHVKSKYVLQYLFLGLCRES